MSDLAVVSQWSHLVEGLSYSSQEFYESVEQAVTRWQVPDIRISRVSHQEGSIFSGSREYLRVVRQDHTFDCCAAPFGSGFFVSWWLLENESFIEKLAHIPVFGIPIRLFVTRPTYFRHDSALMFQAAIDDAVKQALDGICKVKGVRGPTELERKPMMREFYARK